MLSGWRKKQDEAIPASAKSEPGGSADGQHPPCLATYGTLPANGRTWAWERRGDAATLLLSVFIAIANQALYLTLITLNVVYSHDYLMECNPNSVGFPLATMCEWTKAHVRSFPILGLQVSVLVTSRMLLQQRIYYQLLKRGALVDFDNFNPFHDPLFQILVLDFVGALIHFVINLWTLFGFSLETMSTAKLVDTKLIEDASQTAAFYVVPAAVFLSFLYAAYDTEQTLLPLSKYFEEDAEVARQNLSRMALLPEHAGARVLSSGFWTDLQARVRSHDAGGARDPDVAGADVTIDEDIALAEFIKLAGTGHDNPHSDSTAQENSDVALNQWRLVSTLWPARLLLDHRLSGKEATRFRYAWYGFSWFAIGILIVTLLWLLEGLKDKMHDIMNGQASTDWSSAMVMLVHIALWCFLARGYQQHILKATFG